MNNKHLTWLPFLPAVVPAECKTPVEVARFELDQCGLGDVRLCVEKDQGDGFHLEKTETSYVVTGGETGVLYGAYRLMMALKAGEKVVCSPKPVSPFYALRMINCWDNAEGTVERGYAGRSLFFENGWFDYEPARMRQLGRMMASVGLNVLCINNVNVHEPAHKLIEEEWLPEVARLAGIFRPFGVKLMLCIDYAHPMRHGIPTADPLDERVAQWWMKQTEKVYRAVPDLAGYLVKADSEHRPGPFTYGCTHADGANMLARALRPHGGVLVWRCFVYNCMQDWRDAETDRP